VSPYECYFVARTLGTLELLAVAPRSSREVADELAIHERTARRILRRLVDEGYAERRAARGVRYHLTPRFAHLAARALLQQIDAEAGASSS
jgi:DNA-binding IclR family transcriptional regulator